MFEYCSNFWGVYGTNGFGWVGGIAMLIGLILIGVIIYLLVSNSRNTETKSSAGAVEVLKERLAKGEIDEDTYERLLKKIN